MHIQSILATWEYAAIKIMDIRKLNFTQETVIKPYRLPSSVWIIWTSGKAKIKIGKHTYRVEEYTVLHSGKGKELILEDIQDVVEYYMIFYRGTFPYILRKRLRLLLDTASPFEKVFTLKLQKPLPVLLNIQQLHEKWLQSSWQEHLLVQGLFYQMLYEIFRQLDEATVTPAMFTQQIQEYIENNYNEAIKLDTFVQQFNYSKSYITSIFKKHTGYTIIDYVLHIRMQKAQQLLRTTSVSIKEIAEYVGYEDVHYFMRLFKRNVGTTPGQYRNVANHPQNTVISSIEANSFTSYIDNHYQTKQKGGYQMFKKSSANLVATMLLCLSLLLSGCSIGGNDTKTENNTNEAGRTATYIYKAANGDIEIPKEPKRIVVTGHSYAGYVLALGVKPVGITDFALSNPFYGDLVEGIENIGDDQSLEKITALNPDLIISFTGIEGLENLEKIAPTVAVDYAGKNYRQHLLELGKMLGREDEAKQWIADWDEKITTVKPQIQDVVGNKTVSIIGGTKALYAYGKNWGRGGEILYQELELTPPERIQKDAIDSGTGWAEFSLEVLSEFAGDYIFLDSGKESIQFLQDHAVWSNLDAVKNNQVFLLDEASSYFNDPITLEHQLDFIVKSFTETN